MFIPTASNDAQGYWKTFQRVYGEKLGCKTETLFLIKEKLTRTQIRNKIFGADLIYVGGGNTLRLFKVWKKSGVDKMLKEAYKKGIVLSGLSAGAICWFKKGFSDSAEGKKGTFGLVKGIGLIEAICCPHYNNKKRAKAFSKTMQKQKQVGIGIEDNCAIIVKQKRLNVIVSKKQAKAHLVLNIINQNTKNHEGYQ